MRARAWGLERAGVLLLLVALGCAGGGEELEQGGRAVDQPGQVASAGSPATPARPPASAGADPGRPAPDTLTWTAGIVERSRPGVGVATLVETRTAANPGFDRVVFEFAGDTLPGYHIEYVDRPVRQCGSGEPVEVAGEGWLQVRLVPARAHDDEGRATITDRARRLDLPVLKEFVLTCDFEAHVEWVLGVASPNRYRVMELQEPARLVVDVRHQ